MVSTYLHTIISFCQGASIWQTDGRTDGQTDVDSKVWSNKVRCAQKSDSYSTTLWHCIEMKSYRLVSVLNFCLNFLICLRCRCNLLESPIKSQEALSLSYSVFQLDFSPFQIISVLLFIAWSVLHYILIHVESRLLEVVLFCLEYTEWPKKVRTHSVLFIHSDILLKSALKQVWKVIQGFRTSQ